MNVDEHHPVLLEEVFSTLRLKRGEIYLDLTAGRGGHACRAAEAVGPEGMVIVVDRDADSLRFAADRVAGTGVPVRAVHGNFADVGRHLDDLGIRTVDAVLADLGLCTVQLKMGRGMSLRDTTSADMRMDVTTGITAEEYLTTVEEGELARVLREYGDQPGAHRVARAIVDARRHVPITSTAQLADIVAGAAPRCAARSRIHPATVALQSIRMVINSEIESLDSMLPAALARLRVGGRLCVIAFHSGEARVVKKFIDKMRNKCICEPGLLDCRCGRALVVESLTPRAVKAGALELAQSAPSRSAVMRAAVKVAAWPM